MIIKLFKGRKKGFESFCREMNRKSESIKLFNTHQKNGDKKKKQKNVSIEKLFCPKQRYNLRYFLFGHYRSYAPVHVSHLIGCRWHTIVSR